MSATMTVQERDALLFRLAEEQKAKKERRAKEEEEKRRRAAMAYRSEMTAKQKADYIRRHGMADYPALPYKREEQ